MVSFIVYTPCMTMPHARKIVLDGRTYLYLLKGGHHSLIGWSAKTLRLVVELEPGKYFSNTFASKAWTSEHEENQDCAPAHKVSFMPSDIKAVINALEDHSGSLPEAFELPSWTLVTKA